MNEQEIEIIKKWILDFKEPDKVIKILNVGSGDRKYYTEQQPHIWNNLIVPLMEKGCVFFHMDPKDGEGIDLKCSLKDIPTEDQYFDVVLFSSVIEHIHPKDIEENIKQMYRVLRKDGIIIASAPASYPIHDSYDNGLRFENKSFWFAESITRKSFKPEINSISCPFNMFNDDEWIVDEFVETDKIPAKDFYKGRWDMSIMTYMTMWRGKRNPGIEVTVLVPNWKRPENFEKIIEGIEKSTVKSKMLIWDNSERMEFVPYKEERIICSSHNYQSQVKNVAALLVDTPFILFQDDDLQLHPRAIERMLECCKKNPGSVVCLKYGVLDEKGNYVASKFSSLTKPIDFTVGRVMMMQTSLVGAAFNPNYAKIIEIGEEDLVLGLAVQMFTGKPSVVMSCHDCKPVELPSPHGRCSRKYHYANRTKTVEMFRQLGWESKIQ